MTYSLVSAASLGFDLVRLPCGEQVARVLLTALHAGPVELRTLAAAHPGPGRRLRWQEVRCAGPQDSVRQAIRLAAPAVELLASGEQEGGTAVLRRLERAPLGDLDALDRLVRREVLDWTWRSADDVATQSATATRASDVLVDAAASAYCAEHLPAPLRRELAGPYLNARQTVSQAESPAEPAVARLLEDFATPSPANRQAWRRAADAQRASTARWAPAMHEASWAVHLSGRLRIAAAEQLRAVSAFRSAGFDARDGAFGVWNAIAGVVQATVVRDLIAEEHRAELVRPWVLARGTEPDGEQPTG